MKFQYASATYCLDVTVCALPSALQVVVLYFVVVAGSSRPAVYLATPTYRMNDWVLLQTMLQSTHNVSLNPHFELNTYPGVIIQVIAQYVPVRWFGGPQPAWVLHSVAS